MCVPAVFYKRHLPPKVIYREEIFWFMFTDRFIPERRKQSVAGQDKEKKFRLAFLNFKNFLGHHLGTYGTYPGAT